MLKILLKCYKCLHNNDISFFGFLLWSHESGSWKVLPSSPAHQLTQATLGVPSTKKKKKIIHVFSLLPSEKGLKYKPNIIKFSNVWPLYEPATTRETSQAGELGGCWWRFKSCYCKLWHKGRGEGRRLHTAFSSLSRITPAGMC